jgi:hypothetical protein
LLRLTRSSLAFLCLLVLVAAGPAGCSGEQAYSAGQSWQRNQCARLPDKAEYDRCMADANRSYDSYKREKDGSTGPSK